MATGTHEARITILVDNQAERGFTAEHGLALWVEVGQKRIIFDTGQGPALPINTTKLGIALEEVDFLVLSHGHYDHTGAIPYVLASASGVEVYCHPAVVGRRYSCSNGRCNPIHMPGAAKTALNKLPVEQLHWVLDTVRLSPLVGLTGPIARFTDYEDTSGPFFLDAASERPDPLDDDMALWVATNRGLVVCVGCCHAGLINTLAHVRRSSGISKIRAVVGGFHLLNASDERLVRTITALSELRPDMIVPCHCTGQRADQALRRALPGRVQSGSVAKVYEF